MASRSASTSLHGTAGTAPRELCSCPRTAVCAAVSTPGHRSALVQRPPSFGVVTLGKGKINTQ